MKKVQFEDSWPEDVKESYHYDLLEVYGQFQKSQLGYVYQYQLRQNSTLELVRRCLPNGGKILDVAAAQGNFSLLLAEMGYDVTWNDLRGELKEYVQQKWEKGKVDYRAGNVFDLGFKCEYDLVLITEIIEHVAHPDDFLSKIASLVKTGGYIVMTTPNGEYFLNRLPKFSECSDPSIYESQQFKPNSDGHIFLLHLDEIYTLAEKANLDVREIKIHSNSLTCGHAKLRYLLKVLSKDIVYSIEEFSQNMPALLKKKMHSHLSVLMQRKV